jgi:hypothetical protein
LPSSAKLSGNIHVPTTDENCKKGGARQALFLHPSNIINFFSTTTKFNVFDP